MLPERVDERAGIETIERDRNRARIEARNEALRLVGLDPGAGRIVEAAEASASGRIVSALEITDDVTVINSFSKYYSMTGWRIGWMVVPEAHVRPVERLAQNLFICPPHASQVAALASIAASAATSLSVWRTSSVGVSAPRLSSVVK